MVVDLIDNKATFFQVMAVAVALDEYFTNIFSQENTHFDIISIEYHHMYSYW